MIKKIFIILLYILLLVYFSNKTIEHFVPDDILTEFKSVKTLHTLLKKMHNTLNDIPYWVTGGTLLGAIREKTIIPWDNNVNIAIMDTNVNKFTNITKGKFNLNKTPFGFEITEDNAKMIVYIMKDTNNKIESINQKNKYYDSKDLFPLKLCKFEDYQVYIPNNPNNYLDQNFNNWKKSGQKDNKHFDLDYNVNDKPYLWRYWDNKNDNETPAYIQLCMETVNSVCSKSFNIVTLNKHNILEYLPELKEFNLIEKVDKLIIAHKVDLYRIMLLYKYGGIYMDADIIALKDPIDIINRLDNHEVVGFGCTGVKCNYGYSQPSNWIIASRPTSILMGRVLRRLINKLETQDTFDYHDLGKLIIWEEIANLKESDDYIYYHYPNKVDGSRDIDGNWITSAIAFSNQEINYEDEEGMLFFVIYNSEIPDSIKKMSRSELLSQDWNFTRFIKKTINI